VDAIVCRAVTARDEPFLWQMLFLASHSGDDPDATVATARRDPELSRYVDRWGRPGDRGVIASTASVDVGAAWARLPVGDARDSPAFFADDVPEIAIAVAHGFEGRGIGTVMLRSLLDELRTSCMAVTLNARADNPAVRLYARLGFLVVDEIVNRVGTTSLKMLRSFDA
jgi:ribosomal protein S18 acetylase RimI-like enzyme